jgi:pyruvate-formate lyase-activating enzyme
MMRPIICGWCYNPTHNQYGRIEESWPYCEELIPGKRAYNHITQSTRFRTVFLHINCRLEFSKMMREEYGLTRQTGAGIGFFAELYFPNID